MFSEDQKDREQQMVLPVGINIDIFVGKILLKFSMDEMKD